MVVSTITAFFFKKTKICKRDRDGARDLRTSLGPAIWKLLGSQDHLHRAWKILPGLYPETSLWDQTVAAPCSTASEGSQILKKCTVWKTGGGAESNHTTLLAVVRGSASGARNVPTYCPLFYLVELGGLASGLHSPEAQNPTSHTQQGQWSIGSPLGV